MYKPIRDDLILRSLSEGHASDYERLPDFYASINAADDTPDNKERFRQWVRDLLNGHITISLDDVFVVVDPTQDDMLVSATLLIPQVWRYEDIPLSVGRPELVATHPEYRHRGLVRALFEAVHERSTALGHELQVITGIPYFYRQFGYTMAVDLGAHAIFSLAALADPKPDYQPSFRLRAATVADAPKLAAWYDYFARERLLTEVRSLEVWRYEIAGHHPDSSQALSYQIITSMTGEDVGFLELYANPWDKAMIPCTAYVTGERASYLETFDDVMQAVKQWALTRFGQCPPLLAFGAGIHESLDRLIDRALGGNILQHEHNYKWYLRVPDPLAFLWRIQPVLERRLEGSGAHRYSGELKIGFYDRTGLALTFERGHITDITPLTVNDGYDITFPWHLFWNVVFCHHSYNDIHAILPDVWANPKAAVLLDALFPKKQSWLRGQG